MSDAICPMCGRPMPAGSFNQHHLIPKTYKGADVIDLHKICHDKIHHTFSEAELYQYYHTIPRLVEHPDIRTFVKWVRKQPPSFYDKHKDTRSRKRKR